MARILSLLRVWLERNISPQTMKAIRPFLTVQFVIFMAMGILNTAVSVATATALDILLSLTLPSDNPFRLMCAHSRLTFIVGYSVSLITSFFLNSRFTFRQKPTLRNFIKFPVSYLPNFIFQYLMVFIFTMLHQRTTIAYICAAVLGTPVTFAAMKLVVFRRKRKG